MMVPLLIVEPRVMAAPATLAVNSTLMTNTNVCQPIKVVRQAPVAQPVKAETLVMRLVQPAMVAVLDKVAVQAMVVVLDKVSVQAMVAVPGMAVRMLTAVLQVKVPLGKVEVLKVAQLVEPQKAACA